MTLPFGDHPSLALPLESSSHFLLLLLSLTVTLCTHTHKKIPSSFNLCYLNSIQTPFLLSSDPGGPTDSQRQEGLHHRQSQPTRCQKSSPGFHHSRLNPRPPWAGFQLTSLPNLHFSSCSSLLTCSGALHLSSCGYRIAVSPPSSIAKAQLNNALHRSLSFSCCLKDTQPTTWYLS